ncbi:MAG TPA: hypothetical protein DCY20_04340 [Firmicutes bacterium]|nr:hypothetical protein [Bacillota bacterium]
MNELPRLVESKDIRRGKVFYVALPYTQGRPFRFLEKDSEQPDRYKVITRPDGFEGRAEPETGKRRSENLEIVTGIKLRPCIVIQKDQYNRNENYPFVVILPIATLSNEHKQRPIFKRLIEHNDLDQFYYLGNDCYITVNDPQRVYKNTLFHVEGRLKINEDDFDMEELMKRFADCFEVFDQRKNE